MTTPQQSPFHRTVNLGALNGTPADTQPATGTASPTGSDPNSIKDYISKLKQQLSDAYDNLKEYKKQSELYRGEIEQMRHVLESVN
mmetsp:Transcript_8091/g.9317  ORF Transcript_8091/g.9317 Transcript_8091/m.9317 type:complete len:86 (+) Transcript_8091:1-258(+)|eukprot:CAMPEP_0170468060 /NCGR_PEP_ID=MMETSP0123-20130129/11386_1 /TAXON_ID=182087 /ORGANISM="Favella ehrenbergii, Strain Fehren 1" /LENGTH=85 /DNA_ID=CAMNT_0010734543 /DNA_START=8 /DNA_END=265 /DNA_ORIENTATION=+